jgi:hypothetical protein
LDRRNLRLSQHPLSNPPKSAVDEPEYDDVDDEPNEEINDDDDNAEESDGASGHQVLERILGEILDVSEANSGSLLASYQGVPANIKYR